jgi:hypothetical protein
LIFFMCAVQYTTPMSALVELARELNRSQLYLRTLLERFGLGVSGKGTVPVCLRNFLRALVSLRALGVAEESLRDLWEMELKLLRLLHVDDRGSPTWKVDGWAETGHPARRLFLTRHDVGFVLTARILQPGLNFAPVPAELFSRKDMGEDSLRVLDEVLALSKAIRATVRDEMPVLRDAIYFAARMRDDAPNES